MVKLHKFGIKKKTMYDGLLVSDIWLRMMAYFFVVVVCLLKVLVGVGMLVILFHYLL